MSFFSGWSMAATSQIIFISYCEILNNDEKLS